jgi:hypothetical protein
MGGWGGYGWVGGVWVGGWVGGGCLVGDVGWGLVLVGRCGLLVGGWGISAPQRQ